VTQGFELDPEGWERASKYPDYAVLDHWLDVGRAEFFCNNPPCAQVWNTKPAKKRHVSSWLLCCQSCDGLTKSTIVAGLYARALELHLLVRAGMYDVACRG